MFACWRTRVHCARCEARKVTNQKECLDSRAIPQRIALANRATGTDAVYKCRAPVVHEFEAVSSNAEPRVRLRIAAAQPDGVTVRGSRPNRARGLTTTEGGECEGRAAPPRRTTRGAPLVGARPLCRPQRLPDSSVVAVLGSDSERDAGGRLVTGRRRHGRLVHGNGAAAIRPPSSREPVPRVEHLVPGIQLETGCRPPSRVRGPAQVGLRRAAVLAPRGPVPEHRVSRARRLGIRAGPHVPDLHPRPVPDRRGDLLADEEQRVATRFARARKKASL